MRHHQTAAMTAVLDNLRNGTDDQRRDAAKALLVLLKQYEEADKLVIEMGGIRNLIDNLRSGSEDTWYYTNLCFDLLALDADVKQCIMDDGICEPLIEVIRTASEAVAPNAMLLLSKCVIFNRANQDIFAAAGAIPLLVSHLQSANTDVQSNAAGALWNLAGKNRANQVAIAKSGAFPPLIRLVVRRADTLNAAGALWNIIATSDPVQSIKVTDVEVLRCLVAVLPTLNRESREWVVLCFDTLTSSNPLNTPVVVEAGGVAATLDLLRAADYSSELVLHQILSVLLRMVQMCPEQCGEELITLGAVPALIDAILRPLTPAELEQVCPIKENAVKVLNVLRGLSNVAQEALAQPRSVTALLQLLANTTPDCVTLTVTLLRDLCRDHPTVRQTVAASESGLRALVTILRNEHSQPTSQVVTEVSELLKSVCEERALASALLLRVGAIPVLVNLRQECSGGAMTALLHVLAADEVCRTAIQKNLRT